MIVILIFATFCRVAKTKSCQLVISLFRCFRLFSASSHPFINVLYLFHQRTPYRKKPVSNLSQSWIWNLFLITAGSTIYAIGIKAIAIHHNFITGGIFGAALLLNYTVEGFSPSIWFFLLNVPLFIISYFFVGKRFFAYSLYGMIITSLAAQFITLNFHIHEQIYAAIASGLICGLGTGIIFRSLGSAGGLDIVAVMLYTRFNIGVGRVYLFFNAILFGLAASLYSPDMVIASIILVFINSTTLDQVMTLFSQRKIVYVISDHSKRIAKALQDQLSQGATFIRGKGAYSGQDKLILMAITNNIQLKKMENIVFETDNNALFIVENSFNVIGSGFGKRKLY
nr:YitT family protein [Desulfogranum marinum]